MAIFTKSKANGLLGTMQTLYDSNQFTDIELKVGEDTFKFTNLSYITVHQC